MIEPVYLLLEIVTYLLIINDLHDKKFKLDFLAVITIAVEVILFKLTNNGILPVVFRIVPYVTLTFYVVFEFSTPVIKMIINMLIAILVMGSLQMGIGVVSFFIKSNEICSLFVNLGTLCVALYITRFGKLKEIIGFIKKNSKGIIFLIGNSAILLIIVLVIFRVKGELTILEYGLMILLYGFSFILVLFWKKEKQNLLKKEKEISYFQQYHNSEKQLLKEIRHRQHEYKNQLNALLSTHYTCSSYEELVEAQKKYADWLSNNNKYNDLLLSCKAKILAGFIFHKLLEMEEKEIKVSYTVSVCEIENPDLEFNLMQVFGILIDNAIEAVYEKQKSDRMIQFEIVYSGNSINIVVKNISAYISNKQIQKYFKDGYSSKGENRGFGLSNIMDLKNEMKGEIVISNVEYKDRNWIVFQFTVKIPDSDNVTDMIACTDTLTLNGQVSRTNINFF